MTVDWFFSKGAEQVDHKGCVEQVVGLGPQPASFFNGGATEPMRGSLVNAVGPGWFGAWRCWQAAEALT